MTGTQRKYQKCSFLKKRENIKTKKEGERRYSNDIEYLLV